MKLNLGERFTALGVLPKEGNFTTLKIVRDLQNILAPTEQEFKEFEIKQQDTQIAWNKKGAEEQEIEIGEKATDVIIEALKQLDKDKKLMPSHLSIWEKFIKD